ncbi:hypothetical protein DBR06_SOUSAS10710003, partial [Sousa chinensis]
RCQNLFDKSSIDRRFVAEVLKCDKVASIYIKVTSEVTLSPWRWHPSRLTPPPHTKRSDANGDRGLARSLIAVGLGIAALGFSGHCAFQIWKPLGQEITETAKKISTPSFSSYYKGGFEQKMNRGTCVLSKKTECVGSKRKKSQTTALHRPQLRRAALAGGAPPLPSSRCTVTTAYTMKKL